MEASAKSERKPLLAVDVIIKRPDNSIVLIKRKNAPFKNFYALPGGFVEYGETVEAAAVREHACILKLVGVYSDPERDPRGHVVSIVYLAEERGGTLRPDTDAKEVGSFKKIPKEMAFDHKKILRNALKLLNRKERAQKKE